MEYEKFSLELFNHLTNATERIITKLFDKRLVELLEKHKDGFYFECIDGTMYGRTESELVNNNWFKGYKLWIEDGSFRIRDNMYKYNYHYIVNTNKKHTVEMYDGNVNTIYNSEKEALVASALVEFLIVAYEVYDCVNSEGE